MGITESGKFPVDVNEAPREMLLRVPGLGVRNVERIISIRRWHSIRLDDLTRLRVPLSKTIPFVIVADHTPILLEKQSVINRFVKTQEQRELFEIAA